MFSDALIRAVVNAAKLNRIEPAALLAIVECETSGDIFEADGRTPQFLYERHVAYKESAKVDKRAEFVAAGLAIPKWSRSTQYKDQGTSAKRLALMKRACAISDEAALASASWGVGQTMGFLAVELGFNSARELVDHMTGSVDGQIDCMIREIKGKHLIDAMNDHNWVRVAKAYNGDGYAANQYDTRMASAYARWVRKLATIMTPAGEMRPTPPEQSLTKAAVEEVQTLLDSLGYHEVGTIDGDWGSHTTGAISAFQSHEGLAVSGHYDDATRKMLMTAKAREVVPARAEATAPELIAAGSRTVSHAADVNMLGKVLTGAGGLTAGGMALDMPLPDLTWIVGYWWIAAIGVGLFIMWRARSIIAARLEDHRTGRHPGPAADATQ